ncbi:hypothetical protein BYT27DRAFT_7115405 [Phlegmacium glaucopus]|nr:hypothetical protein BYT27DRAFT_7115405 [Phlegmacium glaucopus]
MGRRAQFPNLFCLARDILCIPGELFQHTDQNLACHIIYSYLGSAVAVERIFSGGRDTISLRRASLNADTIRILMLLARTKANAALHR